MARATAHPDHQCIIRVCVRTDTLFFAWLAVPFAVIRVSASFADAADGTLIFFEGALKLSADKRAIVWSPTRRRPAALQSGLAQTAA
jgi:hypothetical protein